MWLRDAMLSIASTGRDRSALEAYFDSLAEVLLDRETGPHGLRAAHKLPTAAAHHRYAPPHWPTLMACAKLVLK
jgi:hypothetical protein